MVTITHFYLVFFSGIVDIASKDIQQNIQQHTTRVDLDQQVFGAAMANGGM